MRWDEMLDNSNLQIKSAQLYILEEVEKMKCKWKKCRVKNDDISISPSDGQELQSKSAQLHLTPPFSI